MPDETGDVTEMSSEPSQHAANVPPKSVMWKGWIEDPLIDRVGLTFDRSPSGEICAPTDMVRVCAYHIDFDERPTCYRDVQTSEAAESICDNLDRDCPAWNVDYAVAYDDRGAIIYSSRPY